MARLSFTLAVVALAAVVTLGLAALGLYGVVAYLVARRTGEIGLRMALGASPRRIRSAAVASSGKLVLAGLAIGAAASLAASATLQSLVFGVSPTRPLAYGLGVRRERGCRPRKLAGDPSRRADYADGCFAHGVTA